MFLQTQYWMYCAADLTFELLHCEEEGKIVSDELNSEIVQILNMEDSSAREIKAADIYKRLLELPIASDFPYCEPSDWAAIKGEFSCFNDVPKYIGNQEETLNRVYGGWLGRAAGCLLGKPVEGWKRARITGLLKDNGNYPARCYIRSDIPKEVCERYNVLDKTSGGATIPWGNNVSFMPEDDDTNYTVLSLKTVEEYGRDFSQEQMAESWLNNLPILHTCTAERVAYRNFTQLIEPPRSAIWHNPYREWIGAQIRTDFYGYINPGDPMKAAHMAWTDASISHVKNGIYGATYVAAMISTAFTTANPLSIVEAGLSYVPKKSRLSRDIKLIISWYQQGKTRDEVLDSIHKYYDENNSHHWTHTLSNAMIVTAALLYGKMELGDTIAFALEAAFDTDCNCATAGSIVGVAVGAVDLPKSWIAPLCDTLLSGVDGFHSSKISHLAQRTVDLIK